MSEAREHKVIMAHCPECNADRNAEVAADVPVEFSDEDSGIWGRSDYRILRCRGCDMVYFQEESVFSEDFDHRRNPKTGEWEQYLPSKKIYWPPRASRRRPIWNIQLALIDAVLSDLLDSVYTAFDNNLMVLAAIGVRTVFDRASELLGVSQELTFGNKLAELERISKTSGDERELLEVLTTAGSAAAHRGWKPSLVDLELMLSSLENFLHRSFVLSDAAKQLKLRVPARAPRAPKTSP